MGKILLSGFKLEKAERSILNNIIRSYKTKLERLGFEELRLDLRQRPHSKHAKRTLYKLKGQLIAGKKFSSKEEGLNLYLITDKVLEKLLHEIEHKTRIIRIRRRRI